MIKLKNHDYALFSNIIITGILQISFFNVVGLISVILSLAYLCLLLFSNYKSKILLVLFALAITSGLAYYFLKPLYDKSNLTSSSIVPGVFLLFLFINALSLPKIKRNAFYGVRTSLALNNDEVWKKVNNAGSIIAYIMLMPLYTLILYIKDEKIMISIFCILFYASLTIAVALFIERKYQKEFERREMLELQKQKKKETGGDY